MECTDKQKRQHYLETLIRLANDARTYSGTLTDDAIYAIEYAASVIEAKIEEEELIDSLRMKKVTYHE